MRRPLPAAPEHDPSDTGIPLFRSTVFVSLLKIPLFVLMLCETFISFRCSYTQISLLLSPRYLHAGLHHCYLLLSDIGVFFFPFFSPQCMEPEWMTLPPPQMLFISGSTARFAFKHCCTCGQVMQLQRNVCSCKWCFVKESRSLRKTVHLNARSFEEKKKTPNCDHTTTSTTIQILQGWLRACGLSATFVRHSIVSFLLYKSWGEAKTLVSYVKNRGYFFN